MDYVWLLFGFDGRINRGRFWLSCLLNVGFMLLLGGVALGVSHMLGGPSRFAFSVEDIFAVVDPVTWRSLSTASLPHLAIKALGAPVFLWIYLAVAIKRLHDRNRSGWWIVAFFIVPGVIGQFEDRFGDTLVFSALNLVQFGLALWGVVEMGFLRGTSGPNRFGADPLAPVDRRPGWSQEGELEAVPRAAPAPKTITIGKPH